MWNSPFLPFYASAGNSYFLIPCLVSFSINALIRWYTNLQKKVFIYLILFKFFKKKFYWYCSVWTQSLCTELRYRSFSNYFQTGPYSALICPGWAKAAFYNMLETGVCIRWLPPVKRSSTLGWLFRGDPSPSPPLPILLIADSPRASEASGFVGW